MKTRYLTYPLSMAAVLLGTQCTGWKYYQTGNEFETVFDNVPMFAEPDSDAWTKPARVLPRGERMALIDWVPAEANVVLANATEGYVSTLEIAPVVDLEGNAIKSRISRRGHGSHGSPVIRTQPQPRWTPSKIFTKPSAPQVAKPKVTTPKLSAPKYTPKPKVTTPKVSAPKPTTPTTPTSTPPKGSGGTGSTQIERLFPKKTTPTPESTPEFRPLP